MNPEKENFEDLEQFELLIPAKRLFDKMVQSTNGYEPAEMTEDVLKQMKLVLGFLNAYRGAYGNKLQYFKLTVVAEKNGYIKSKMKMGWSEKK